MFFCHDKNVAKCSLSFKQMRRKCCHAFFSFVSPSGLKLLEHSEGWLLPNENTSVFFPFNHLLV